MTFLPNVRVTLQTSLSPDQVREKLSNELETSPFASWSSITTNKVYRGTVGENKFDITPIVFYNNFTPVIQGDILHEIGSTKIRVRMLPHFYLAMFMVLSLGFLGFIFFLLLAAWVFSTGTFEESPVRAILAVSVMFVVVYLFLVGGFMIEVSKSTEHLRKLLDATEVQS